MARRKRLELAEDLADGLNGGAGGGGGGPAEIGRHAAAAAGRGTLAPIARLAGEAAAEQGREIARLREAAGAAGRLAAAEAEGRVLADVRLDEIDGGFLARDRLGRPDEDDAARALKASIRASGQRMPVELVQFARETADGRPYGLVSGWRRLQALRALHRETGEARFATVRAMVRRELALAPAFLAMVEENEIRANLSFYERGRIAALAARHGAFPSAEAAVEALFAAASPAKRSKIRSFLMIFEALGDLLAWPEAISERQGLALARALRWGQRERLRHGLGAALNSHRRVADEQRLIKALLAESPAADGRPAAPAAAPAVADGAPAGGTRRGPDPARSRTLALPDGLRVERRSFAGHTDLRISGPGLDERRIAAALDAVVRALGG